MTQTLSASPNLATLQLPSVTAPVTALPTLSSAQPPLIAALLTAIMEYASHLATVQVRPLDPLMISAIAQSTMNVPLTTATTKFALPSVFPSTLRFPTLMAATAPVTQNAALSIVIAINASRLVILLNRKEPMI